MINAIGVSYLRKKPACPERSTYFRHQISTLSEPPRILIEGVERHVPQGAGSKVMIMVVPFPLPSDSAAIFPFCAVTNALQIANPRPRL